MPRRSVRLLVGVRFYFLFAQVVAASQSSVLEYPVPFVPSWVDAMPLCDYCEKPAIDLCLVPEDDAEMYWCRC